MRGYSWKLLIVDWPLSFDQVHFKHEQSQVLSPDSRVNDRYDSANTGRSQRALSISTQ